MTQMSLDFQAKRKVALRRLKGAELAVRSIFELYPELRSVKRRNELIRKVWSLYDDYPAESILRHARFLQSSGEYDTDENQSERANAECAYREYFTP